MQTWMNSTGQTSALSAAVTGSHSNVTVGPPVAPGYNIITQEHIHRRHVDTEIREGTFSPLLFVFNLNWNVPSGMLCTFPCCSWFVIDLLFNLFKSSLVYCIRSKRFIIMGTTFGRRSVPFDLETSGVEPSWPTRVYVTAARYKAPCCHLVVTRKYGNHWLE